MSVLLYGAPIWADNINVREYWRTEMVLVQWKAALRCVSAYRTLLRGSLYAGRHTPIEIVTDECKRVYSATYRINAKSGKPLWVRCEERQVVLHKWKKQLSGSSKGERNCVLIHNFEAWLERDHGQMNFYLTQVLFGHGAFNAYLFHMKVAESPECTNCDRRGWDDDAWHTLFECLAFQLYREDVMTTLQKKGEQPLTPDSLVPVKLKSADGWDQGWLPLLLWQCAARWR